MKKLVVPALTLVALCVVLWSSAAQETGYKVIVNKNNPADSVSKEDLSNILLKKKSRWDYGASAAPIDLDSRSPVREAFSQDVHGRSVSSIKNYWQRQIFSGREVPPPEAGSDAEVVTFVASQPGAIGYVSASARLTDGVKVVEIN